MKKYMYTMIKISLIVLLLLIVVSYFNLFSVNIFINKKNLINYKFLQLLQKPNSNLCQKSEKNFVFAYIFGRVDSFNKRQAIRDTWANKEKFPQLKIAFVTALSNFSEINKKIIEENLLYGDIIQGNFIDSYRNLSYKSLIAFKWISRNCKNAKYILKIDDDVVLNTNELMNFLKNESSYFPNTSFKYLSNTFICRIVTSEAPCRHNGCGKMYTTVEEYNKELYGLENYGKFCSGVAFIMTADLPRSLFFKSFEIKIFWIDDVYVGILGRFLNANYLQLWNWYIEKKETLRKESRKRILFIRDADTIDEIKKIWNQINS